MTDSQFLFRQWFTEPRPDHRRRQFFVIEAGDHPVHGPYTWSEACAIWRFHHAQDLGSELWSYDELMDNNYWSKVLEDDPRFKS